MPSLDSVEPLFTGNHQTMRGGAEAARQAHNLEVGGSNPSPAIYKQRGVAQLAERRSPKPKVAGSIPATPAPELIKKLHAGVVQW